MSRAFKYSTALSRKPSFVKQMAAETGRHFGRTRERSQPEWFGAEPAVIPAKRQFHSPPPLPTSVPGEGSGSAPKRLRAWLGAPAIPTVQEAAPSEIMDGASSVSSGCPGMLTSTEITIACGLNQERGGSAQAKRAELPPPDASSVFAARRLGTGGVTAASCPQAVAEPKQPKKRGLQTFAVERILASRLNTLGKEEYKVRWQGYAERYDTWEPPENFFPGVVEEFKRSKVPPLEWPYLNRCLSAI